jgi:hypothetical protein
MATHSKTRHAVRRLRRLARRRREAEFKKALLAATEKGLAAEKRPAADTAVRDRLAAAVR